MAKYTDREELSAAMQHIYNDPTCPMHIAAEIEQIIDCSPTADVAPVVHGRWMKQYRSGVPVAEGWVSSCCDMWNSAQRHYCPNCGAKMDGAE